MNIPASPSVGRKEKKALGGGTVSTFLWAQKEATLLKLKSAGEGGGCLATERKVGQPGLFISFPKVLGPGCAVMKIIGPVGTGQAQQPSQSDLMLPNFTLFRLWFSSFR